MDQVTVQAFYDELEKMGGVQLMGRLLGRGGARAGATASKGGGGFLSRIRNVFRKAPTTPKPAALSPAQREAQFMSKWKSTPKGGRTGKMPGEAASPGKTQVFDPTTKTYKARGAKPDPLGSARGAQGSGTGIPEKVVAPSKTPPKIVPGGAKGDAMKRQAQSQLRRPDPAYAGNRPPTTTARTIPATRPRPQVPSSWSKPWPGGTPRF